MKEYIVTTKRNVLAEQINTEIISAKSEEDAKRFALSNLNKGGRENDVVNIVVEKIVRKNDILAIIILGISIILSLISWENSHGFVSIRPEGVPFVLGIVFSTVYFFKYKFPYEKNRVINILYVIIWALVLGALIHICLYTKTISLIFLHIDIDTIYVLFIGLIASIFGKRFISMVCYILLLFLVVSQLNIVSEAMGMWFVVYFILIIIGSILYLQNEIKLNQIINDNNQLFNKVSKKFHDNVREVRNDINNNKLF